MKEILVPIDFSKSSLNALEVAAALAIRNNALLQILHIIDIVPEFEENISVDAAGNLCATLADDIQARYGCNIEINIVEGLVGHVIANTVDERKADLVVMGAHGISGPREFFVGTNAYYVIKKAYCPVLLIPEMHKTNSFKKILLPVQQSVFSSKIFEIVDHSGLLNSSKCFVKIMGASKTGKSTPQFSIIVNELKARYHGRSIDIKSSSFNVRDIAESVMMKGEQINADLIVISPGLDISDKPYFVGPFAQRIINHSKVPVLSILRASNN